MDDLKKSIAIVGVGYTPQGKILGRTAISFHTEAIRNALVDAGIEKNEVDAMFLYRYFEALAGDYDVTAFTVAEQRHRTGNPLHPGLAVQQHWFAQLRTVPVCGDLLW